MQKSLFRRLGLLSIIGLLSLTLVPNSQAMFLACDWNGDLYSVNNSNANLSFIGSTGLYGLGSLEFASDGTLYGVTTGTAALYRIDPTTAGATLVGGLGAYTYEGGLAFSSSGVAYVVHSPNASSTSDLLTVDLNTGAGTVVAPIGTSYHDVNGLAWRSDGELVGLSDDASGGQLLTIDPGTGAVSTIAALTFPIGAVGGMATDQATGISYFGTGQDMGNDFINGNNSLYSFDLYSGSSSLIGSFSGFNDPANDGISGLAISSVVPEPATMSLFGLGLLGLGAIRRKFRK